MARSYSHVEIFIIIDMPFAMDNLEPTTGQPMNLHSKLAIFALKIFVSIILLYYYDDLMTAIFASFTMQEISQIKQTILDDDKTCSNFIHFLTQK